MGEGLQARPSSYITTTRITGSGLEALTHWCVDHMNAQ